ncbi:hypothetical protein HanIR_Chr10g0459271 [Helianthus annuus]|nr:hypothetical protein HanIR_Chr10g0459271 [Helianthus annuus]
MRRPRCGALNRIFLSLITCTLLFRLLIHATYNMMSKKKIHRFNQLNQNTTIVLQKKNNN